MKKLFSVLAALTMASALYAAEDTPIGNVCDSLSLGSNPVIELVPAYIEETNWYGNPHTMTKDSSTFKRHESYETLSINVGPRTTLEVPISITAGCREEKGTTVGYAKWTIDKTWTTTTEDDVATNIYDIKSLQMTGHDASNTYNLLAFVPGNIPQNNSFESHQLLYSVTFEFAFEWWFAGVSYNPTPSNISFRSSRGNDSLKVVQTALATFPDTLNTARLQVIKVVLVDSRKLPEPESSSSAPASSSSNVPVSSSSSVNPGTSSSHSLDDSSSSNPPASSSSEVKSSSSVAPASSSSVGTSSSAGTQESSSSEKTESSSSNKPETSSSEAPKSSSSEKSTRLVTAPAFEGSARMVQVRTLDGSIVKNSANLAPGVYYVKYSDGKWHKMAVLPR